jgi:hypothetical protein
MGGDGPKFQVPDWRIYGPKVDEIPMLREHKAKLAVHGLDIVTLCFITPIKEVCLNWQNFIGYRIQWQL